MVNRNVVLLGILLSIISFLFGVYLYEVQPVKGILIEAFVKSEEEKVSTTGIYEVKYSEEEARSWIYLGTISDILYPGMTSTKYISWQRDYPSRLKLDIGVNINPSQYYTCSWYECVDCYLYSYQYCSQYQCTIEAGTPYATCERDEIRQWKCTKTITQEQELSKEYVRTATVKDGPDTFDWWDPDYIEFPINDYPWDALVGDPSELKDYYIRILWYAPRTVVECMIDASWQLGVSAYDLKIIYEDGTEQIIDNVGLGGSTHELYITLEIYRAQLENKKISRIELWEEDHDISECYPEKDITFTFYLQFIGIKEVQVTDTKYVTKSGKQQLEAEGYTCEPYSTVTTTKSYTGISSCDVVQYTTDASKDGKCEGGICYWYCDPEYECKPSPPRTKESGTHTETTTYTASTKEDLYNKGCSDIDISCISWNTKTGTLSDYQNDKIYRDARYPSCSQWSPNTYRSTVDKTKTSGEPPFTQCTYKSTISRETIQDATCLGPFEDTVSQPAKLEIGAISRTYYASSQETLYIDISAGETKYITLEGAKFTNIPNEGYTAFTIKVEALDLNPYIVTQSVEDITPEGATYTAKRYVAVIYSPGNLIARFYPPVCSEFEAEGLKYRFASLDGSSLSGDPCSEGGILLYLHEGNNKFEMLGYSIDPSGFPSCVEKPNTCEEEDLYGCPEQCKVSNLQIVCPSTLTISSGLGEKVMIPITVTAGSEGIIKLSIEGEGVVFIPQEHKVSIGTNPIALEATYYLETKESKKVIWRVVAENPAIRGYPKIKPEYAYCEIRVTVVPKGLVDILKKPEVIISFIVILIGLILLLLGKKPKSK